MKIEIYTDGACSGNPGKGGYGIVMRISGTDYEKLFSEGFRRTTNNRMELLAVITALEKIKAGDHEIHLFTDSKYVADAINKNWIFGWIKKRFKDVKNPDLWQRLIPLLREFQPKIHWVKGHSGHPDNEKADRLAVGASQEKELQTDVFFEENERNLFSD